MLFPWEIFRFFRSGLPKPRYARFWQLSDLRKWKISCGKSNFGFESFYFRGSLFQLLGTVIPCKYYTWNWTVDWAWKNRYRMYRSHPRMGHLSKYLFINAISLPIFYKRLRMYTPSQICEGSWVAGARWNSGWIKTQFRLELVLYKPISVISANCWFDHRNL